MIINQDLHIHTHLSLCAKKSATVEYYVNRAKDFCFDTIGFSDHMWDAPIPGNQGIEFYEVQSYDYICQLKQEIAAVPHPGLRILFGCETEYAPLAHRPAITVETAKKLDFLLVPNSHTHIVMPKELYEPHQAHADFMLQAFYDIIRSDVAPYVTAIAHPFAAVCCPYDNRELIPLLSDEQYYDCYHEAAEKGIAIEINTSSFRFQTVGTLEADPYFQMYKIAKAAGCKFTFGSDSHCDHDHDDFAVCAYTVASRLGLTDDDIRRI